MRAGDFIAGCSSGVRRKRLKAQLSFPFEINQAEFVHLLPTPMATGESGLGAIAALGTSVSMR